MIFQVFYILYVVTLHNFYIIPGVSTFYVYLFLLLFCSLHSIDIVSAASTCYVFFSLFSFFIAKIKKRSAILQLAFYFFYTISNSLLHLFDIYSLSSMCIRYIFVPFSFILLNSCLISSNCRCTPPFFETST